MDARNRSTQTLDLPTIGIYGVQPGQSVTEVAGQYAPLLRTELVAGLLHQGDIWEPADDEATDWLKDHPGPGPAEPPARQPLTDLERMEAIQAASEARPETVGLVPMPEPEEDDRKAVAKAEPTTSRRRAGAATTDISKE
jgi:hypothetical protein